VTKFCAARWEIPFERGCRNRVPPKKSWSYRCRLV